jgi:arabinose-5-phosphate isomerase
MENKDFSFLEQPVSAVMTRNPVSIGTNSLAGEALRILREKKIDQVPVVNEKNQPVGLLDVQDLLTVGIV